VVRSWTTVENFGRIPGYNPSLHLDLSLWLDREIKSNSFEYHSTKFVNETITEDMICLDVGANIGYYTLLMAHKAKKVICFEPSLKYFEVLKNNCEKNLDVSKFELNNFGLSNVNETKEINVFGTSASIFQIDKYLPLRQEKHSIVLKRLDEVVSSKFDFIKIDCDGYDPLVIMGAENYFKKHHPIILMEICPEYYEIAKIDAKFFYAYMTELNYNLYFEENMKLISEKDFLSKYVSLPTGHSSFNIFCMKK
jgi:FkbM family methyltransferase